MKDRGVYVLAVFDCIKRITEYTDGYSLENFLLDRKTQDAAIRNIEVIGQAVKDYGIEDLQQAYPSLPGKQIAGMRNIIAHEYLGVDMTIAWEVVESHLEPLNSAILDLAKTIGIELPNTS